MAREGSNEEQAFFEDLYLRYSKLMFQVAKKYIAEEQGTEDAVQESFARLIPKAGFLRGLNEKHLRAYVVATVRNTAITHGVRQRAAQGIPLDEIDPALYAEESAEAYYLRQESRKCFRRALDSLAEPEQDLLEAKYSVRLADAEIAALLGVQTGTVRMRLTRVRRKVLKTMKEEDSGYAGL